MIRISRQEEAASNPLPPLAFDRRAKGEHLLNWSLLLLQRRLPAGDGGPGPACSVIVPAFPESGYTARHNFRRRDHRRVGSLRF